MLLVEDNEDDALLLSRALKLLKPGWGIIVAATAEAAIQALTRDPPKPTPQPSSIFIDLGLSGTKGGELLRWIDEQPHLAASKVFVVSRAVERAMRLPIQSGRKIAFIPKPRGAFNIAEAIALSWD